MSIRDVELILLIVCFISFVGGIVCWRIYKKLTWDSCTAKYDWILSLAFALLILSLSLLLAIKDYKS